MRDCKDRVDKEKVQGVHRQFKVLGVNRSGLYYASVGESAENMEVMRRMDEHHMEHPTEGVLRMQVFCSCRTLRSTTREFGGCFA